MTPNEFAIIEEKNSYIQIVKVANGTPKDLSGLPHKLYCITLKLIVMTSWPD